MDKKLIIEALSELSIPEITEIMHDVLRSHVVHEDYENGDFYEQKNVMAQVSWGTIHGKTDEEPTISFLGKVHPEVASTKWDNSICQDGKCENCNSTISSHAKVAVCPVCEHKVSCT
ncbi:MAG: hypothetical protein ACMZ64_06690 [Oleiphilus sp.]